MGMIIFNIIMALACFIFAIAFLVQMFTAKDKLQAVADEVAEERDERANARCGGLNVYYSGDVVLTPNVTVRVHNFQTGETAITDIFVNGESVYDKIPAYVEDEYEAAIEYLCTEGIDSGAVNYVDISMIDELQSELWQLDRELYYGRIEYNNRTKKFTWLG